MTAQNKNILDEALAKLALKDEAGARKVLRDFFANTKVPEEDRGELYVDAVTAFLTVQNQITKAQIEDLKNAVEMLEEVNKAEKEIDHKIKIAKTRAKLKE